MISMAISAALIGALFGLRFKVLVLLPAIVIGISGIAFISALNGNAVWTTALLAIIWAVTLQFGYLGGLLIRFVMVASRLRVSASSAVLMRSG